MKIKQKVTLKDIADEAGVSVATVSRALKIPKDKLKTTREKKILSIAEQMGYSANNPLSSGKKLFRILLTCSFRPSWLKIMGETVQKMGNVELDFKEFINPNEDYSKYDGFICRYSDEFADVKGIPVVKMFGSVGEYCPFNVVTYNNTAIGRLAADECIANGCDVFVSYYHNPKLAIARERISAFHDSLEIYDPDARIHKLTKIEHEPQKVFAQIKADGFTKVGIFCNNDYDAYSLHCAIASSGMLKPQDFILIGCDNEEKTLSQFGDKRPMTVDLNIEMMMKTAVRQLINLNLEQKVSDNLVTLVTPEIVK